MNGYRVRGDLHRLFDTLFNPALVCLPHIKARFFTSKTASLRQFKYIARSFGAKLAGLFETLAR